MLDLNPNFTNKHSNRNNYNNNNNNNNNYRHRFNGGSANNVQFRLETMDEDSGLSPPDSPVRFPNRSLSPASRAQAIARGQREMMEMVENMPETSYELSLKDIVDQRLEFTDASIDETQSMEDGEQRLINSGGSQQRRVNRTESSSSKTGRIIVKNGSMNNNSNNNKGLLINMFLPFSVGSKKNKKSFNRTNSYINSFNHSAGVKSSELLNKSGAGAGDGDRRDWWTKVTDTSSSSGGESTSTGRSGSSGSSGSSSGNSLRNNSDRRDDGCAQGCWSFFPNRKRKS
ncbi:uncharacterized protein LOC143554535 [Bidens hawaiensis]|uniref:uncharacterized protein LOC143554535 n=1 Tax=Bidens hawaiensis TaxID=980011 RepID=UPI00404A7382